MLFCVFRIGGGFGRPTHELKDDPTTPARSFEGRSSVPPEVMGKLVVFVRETDRRTPLGG